MAKRAEKPLPKCETCDGVGWQWHKRKNGQFNWGICQSCHGFGVLLTAAAERFGLDILPMPTKGGRA